jgi:hypothetical protein
MGGDVMDLLQIRDEIKDSGGYTMGGTTHKRHEAAGRL